MVAGSRELVQAGLPMVVQVGAQARGLVEQLLRWQVQQGITPPHELVSVGCLYVADLLAGLGALGVVEAFASHA